MKIIRIIRTDDWSGLYIDGKLAHEGHSVEMEHLPFDEPIRIVTNVYVENQWTEDMAYNGDTLPLNWCDIPQEAFV